MDNQRRNITRPTQTHHIDIETRVRKAQDAVIRFQSGLDLPEWYVPYMPHYFTIVELHERAQRAEQALSKVITERILEPSP